MSKPLVTGPKSDASAQRPPRESLSDWLWNIRHSDGLHEQAQLFPLLHGLPPPQSRSNQPLPGLPADMLKAFELKPMKPVAGASQNHPIVGAAASATSAAPPKDVQLEIWELAHRVMQTFTSEWPHTWPRPNFPNDASNPTPDEWSGYARQLARAPECRPKLVQWRDAPDTPPGAHAALVTLISKLQEFVTMQKALKAERDAKVREAQEQARQQELLVAFEKELEQEFNSLRECMLVSPLRMFLRAPVKRGPRCRVLVRQIELSILLDRLRRSSQAGARAQPGNQDSSSESTEESNADIDEAARIAR